MKIYTHSNANHDANDANDAQAQTRGQTAHAYLLHPISPTLSAVVRKSATTAKPKMEVRGSLHDLSLVLSAAQVEDMSALYRWRANLDHWENVYRHRPKKSPTDAPREWWHYALAGTRVTKQRRTKPTWAKVGF